MKMAPVSTPSANEPANDLVLVHTVQLKPMIKAQISARMVSSSISDVAFTSAHQKKLMMMMKMIIIVIIKKSQETTVFSVRQKLTSAMKVRPDK